MAHRENTAPARGGIDRGGQIEMAARFRGDKPTDAPDQRFLLAAIQQLRTAQLRRLQGYSGSGPGRVGSGLNSGNQRRRPRVNQSPPAVSRASTPKLSAGQPVQ